MDTKEHKECCICMGEVSSSTRNTTLKCGHTYHTDCIMENIAKTPSNKNKCCLCRVDFCSEISVTNTDELDTFQDFYEEERSGWMDSVLFLYDSYEAMKYANLENEEKVIHLKKENDKLVKSLIRTQSKLSQEITSNENHKKYKKCSLCKCFGHNSKTCNLSPRENISWKTSYEFPENLVAKRDLIYSIQSGHLGELIREHFIDNVVEIGDYNEIDVSDE